MIAAPALNIPLSEVHGSVGECHKSGRHSLIDDMLKSEQNWTVVNETMLVTQQAQKTKASEAGSIDVLS